jgi:hypothetical protein
MAAKRSVILLVDQNQIMTAKGIDRLQLFGDKFGRQNIIGNLKCTDSYPHHT